MTLSHSQANAPNPWSPRFGGRSLPQATDTRTRWLSFPPSPYVPSPRETNCSRSRMLWPSPSQCWSHPKSSQMQLSASFHARTLSSAIAFVLLPASSRFPASISALCFSTLSVSCWVPLTSSPPLCTTCQREYPLPSSLTLDLSAPVLPSLVCSAMHCPFCPLPSLGECFQQLGQANLTSCRKRGTSLRSRSLRILSQYSLRESYLDWDRWEVSWQIGWTLAYRAWFRVAGYRWWPNTGIATIVYLWLPLCSQQAWTKKLQWLPVLQLILQEPKPLLQPCPEVS